MTLGGALRHCAAASRRADLAATLANSLRAGGHDPRESLHIRSQDPAAAGCRLSTRLDRCSIADLPLQYFRSTSLLVSSTLIDRLPAGVTGCCHADLPPRHVIYDGWIVLQNDRLGLCATRVRSLRHCAVSTSAFPSSPREDADSGSRRASKAAGLRARLVWRIGFCGC